MYGRRLQRSAFGASQTALWLTFGAFGALLRHLRRFAYDTFGAFITALGLRSLRRITYGSFDSLLYGTFGALPTALCLRQLRRFAYEALVPVVDRLKKSVGPGDQLFIYALSVLCQRRLRRFAYSPFTNPPTLCARRSSSEQRSFNRIDLKLCKCILYCFAYGALLTAPSPTPYCVSQAAL